MPSNAVVESQRGMLWSRNEIAATRADTYVRKCDYVSFERNAVGHERTNRRLGHPDTRERRSYPDIRWHTYTRRMARNEQINTARRPALRIFAALRTRTRACGCGAFFVFPSLSDFPFFFFLFPLLSVDRVPAGKIDAREPIEAAR